LTWDAVVAKDADAGTKVIDVAALAVVANDALIAEVNKELLSIVFQTPLDSSYIGI
jgi:hypothetical protein